MLAANDSILGKASIGRYELSDATLCLDPDLICNSFSVYGHNAYSSSSRGERPCTRFQPLAHLIRRDRLLRAPDRR